MKKTITVLAIASLAMLFTANRAHTYGSGAPAGKTGSPGDGGMSCNSAYCHSGPEATDETIVISSYEIGNRLFQITVEAKSSTPFQYQKAGFQACIEDGDGDKIGELATISSTTTKIVEQNYITHKGSGTAPSNEVFGSHHLWSFYWTAPEDFTGEAFVYAASMLTNANGEITGDVHVEGSYTIDVGLGQEELEALKMNVYPNPATEYIEIDVSGFVGEALLVELIDMKGSVKTLYDRLLEKDHIKYRIPPSQAEGIYLVNLTSSKANLSKSILLK